MKRVGVMALILLAAGAVGVGSYALVSSLGQNGSGDAGDSEVAAVPLSDVKTRIGYEPRLPRYVPAGIKRTDRRVVVIPSRRQVDIGYDSPAPSDPTALRPGFSISIAPSGMLAGGNRAAMHYDVRKVTVHGEQATIDSWNSERVGEPDRNHRFRSVVWSEGGYDIQITAEGIDDAELQRIAESMPRFE